MEKYASLLIWKVAEKCFGGKMPHDSGAVVSAIVNVCLTDAPPEVLSLIVPCLFDAANKYLAMQHFQFPL